MARDKPTEVLLWQMTNRTARDFRVETEGRRYTSSAVSASADGLFRALVPAPATGWTAYFMELTFDVGATSPLKLTTEISITPDTLPFIGKPPDLATSVTMICTASDESRARKVARDVHRDLRQVSFAKTMKTHVSSNRLFINWEPTASIYDGGQQMQAYLEQKECDRFNYQLESGSEITLPPVNVD